MNTIKIYLAESGRIADLRKDFPLYQGQYQNKLLNIFVPTSILAPNFSVQQAGQTIDDYVSSTAVKIGMRTIERNGKIYTSKTYYMRYLKTLTYQNVEYALYERKLPREFTFYAGQGENAPVLIANVVNVNNETDPATIIEITPSQTCSLDVMPSGYLDTDEPVEATALEQINSRLNSIDGNLALKQNIQDDTLETTAKTIVGAINENKGRIDTNTQDIETNRQNIATNRNDIDRILESSARGEEYVGQLRGVSLPTDQQLTDFVESVVDRQPKSGDVVIFIYEIDGETDKNYKYIYSASGWKGYEIPPIENASNGSLGLIEGTYTIEEYDMLVDISGGQILNIYIKDGNGDYRNLVEYLNTTTQDIADIIDGTSVVGEAMRALEDGVGNNIFNTYLTKNLGATKQYVRDYAMPREFNDTYFIATAGYLEQVPTTPESGVQFTATTNNVGDFQLFQISRENKADFELSAKNGYSNNIYVSASADCVVSFRLTTQYKKLGQDWADLNVELTSPITLTAGEIQKLMFGNPFTYLGEDVITLTDGDMFRQTLEVVTQTSSAIAFDVYSNEIYPSTFNLTVQSYTLSGIELSEGKVIMIGLDGVIEDNKVKLYIQNPESYEELLTNGRELLATALLPVVGELDRTLPVEIYLRETPYNVYSFMKGLTQPITIGDFYSVGEYSQELGYAFVSKLIFLETSDYVGFAISPATITANQLANIIDDTETIIHSLDPSGTRLRLNLSATQVNKLMKALQTPSVAPSEIELVAISTTNSQILLSLGDNLYIEDGKLHAVGGDPSGGGTDNYQELYNKPIMNTTSAETLSPNASETINGTINLHKVSKTGALADTIQDSTHRTVTDTEKTTWNNKSDFDGSFTNLTNVPNASNSQAGIIQIATDIEAQTGTNELKAINSKQLKTAIDGLGTVFDLKGTKATINDLPSSGNEIGDVWYVISEQVAYIWLNDGTTNRWEQFGSPIDLSGYMQYTDIVNALNSTDSQKVLSAAQGKVLYDTISQIQQQLGTLSGNVVTKGDNQTISGVKTFTNSFNQEMSSALNTSQFNVSNTISSNPGIVASFKAPNMPNDISSIAMMVGRSLSLYDCGFFQFFPTGDANSRLALSMFGKDEILSADGNGIVKFLNTPKVGTTNVALMSNIPTFSLDGTTLTITLP